MTCYYLPANHSSFKMASVKYYTVLPAPYPQNISDTEGKITEQAQE